METRDEGRATASGLGAPDATGPVDANWFLASVRQGSDLIVVIDANTTVLSVSEAGRALLGWVPAQVVGRSIAEFLHPDDLDRAAEVMALEARGAFSTFRITPALYRVVRSDGSYVSLGINAAPSADGDGALVLVARLDGDLVITDRLLEAVTAGEPFDRQAALVMELGQWRHPDEGYAILYRELDGAASASTSEGLPPALCGQESLAGATPWDLALATHEDVVVSDLSVTDDTDPRIGPDLVARARDAGFIGCIAAPVADPGHAAGACIVIWTRAEGPTGSGHGYAIGNMRRALALVLQQRAQIDELERAARVDNLTGVTSRAWFFDLMDRATEHSAAGSHILLYIDVDRFKSINDAFGHAGGDRVLAVAAGRLGAVAPPSATVARLGGDEFVILLPPGSPVASAHDLAQRIVEVMAEPIDLDGTSLTVGASVGVAVGEGGQNPHDVLDAADRALFEAKARGRGRWHAN